jgi:hypothetical protein
MKSLGRKFVAQACAAILLIASCGVAGPAHSAGAFVYTDFAADNFGVLGQSDIYGQDMKGSTKLEDWKQLQCTGWDDPSCAIYDYLYADLILSPCATDADRACLDSVEAKNSAGLLEKLTLYGEASTKKIAAFKFKNPNELVDLPAGGGLSVWKSNLKNSDGSDRYYAAHVLLRYTAGSNRTVPGGKPIIGIYGFKGSLYPVKLVTTSNCREFVVKGQCATSINYDGNEKMALSLRMNKSLTGWIFGRMQNADFAVTPLDDNYNTIRIAGDVTFVPELIAKVAKSDIAKDPKLEKYLQDFFTVGPPGLSVPMPGNGSYNDEAIGGLVSKTYPDFLAAQTTTRLISVNFEPFALFSAFEDQLQPYSPAFSNNGRNILRETNSIFWNFNANAYTGNNACSADKTKLHGLVVTNAPITEQGPPEFKDGSLNYRVAGIHKNIDGSDFQGRYTYIVRSDTARCYYGFSKAPIQASVQVISSNNSSQVASVLVSERDGFIKLQADNFTFSSPTIKIKLEQPAASAPTPVAKPTPSVAPVTPTPAATSIVAPVKVAKTLTLTCVKGKVIKKVTGVNPHCPIGFKKK